MWRSTRVMSVSQHVSQPKPNDIQRKVQDKKLSSFCRGVKMKVTSKYNTPYSTYGAWKFVRMKRRALIGLGLKQKFLWTLMRDTVEPHFTDIWKYKLLFKIWKLAQKRCVQRNKGLRKNRFMIEISTKIFSYSVKFDERENKREKSMGFTKMLFFCCGWTWKNSGLLRWLILRQTKKWLLSP